MSGGGAVSPAQHRVLLTLTGPDLAACIDSCEPVAVVLLHPHAIQFDRDDADGRRPALLALALDREDRTSRTERGQQIATRQTGSYSRPSLQPDSPVGACSSPFVSHHAPMGSITGADCRLTRLRISYVLAAVATVLRPTNVLIWIPIALQTLFHASMVERLALIREAVIIGYVLHPSLFTPQQVPFCLSGTVSTRSIADKDPRLCLIGVRPASLRRDGMKDPPFWPSCTKSLP